MAYCVKEGVSSRIISISVKVVKAHPRWMLLWLRWKILWLRIIYLLINELILKSFRRKMLESHASITVATVW